MVNHYNQPLAHDKPHMRAMQAFEKSLFVYGDTLSYEWLENALGIPYQGKADHIDAKQNREWMSELKKFRDMMLFEHNMALATHAKKGLIIVKPEEQTKWSESELKLEMRKILSKAAKRLVHIDTSALTSQQMQENQEALGRLAFIKGSIKKSREIGNILKLK